MLTPYSTSITTTLRHKKVVFFIYVLNLIFGLIVALPFASAISSALDHWGSISELISTFDFTLISDFLRNYDTGLGAIISLGKWLIPIYLIFQLFLIGGMIYVFRSEQDMTLGAFLVKCADYFWKNVFMFLVFLIQHGIGLILVIIPISVIVGDGLESLSSEAVYWSVAKWGIGSYAIIFLLVSAASDYAKIELQGDAAGFWRSILVGWKMVFKKFGTTWGILIVNTVLVLISFMLAWNISDWLGVDSVSMVWLSILMHQLINLLRILVRVVYYGALVTTSK